MIAVLETYFEQRRRQALEAFTFSVLEAEHSISPLLYAEVSSIMNDAPELHDPQYAENTRAYNEQQQQLAKELIADLPAGLKHHSIHCLSFRECMSTVIGLTMDQFASLFHSLRGVLAMAYPRCPETLAFGESHKYCERRFRLFLCLYRLKQGATYQQMEVTFGWSSSVLQEWFDVVLRILVHNLHDYHEGFLKFKGPQWQTRQIVKWWYNSIDEYQTKVEFQNTESIRHGSGETINATAFAGSIGAVDGTYCVQPAIGRATLQAHNSDPMLDLMWSEYKRCHAYKLLLVNSHGLDGEPKYLLWVQSACGSASDAAVYGAFAANLQADLVPGAVLLGDHAFHGALNVIAPYTTAQVNTAVGANRAGFNSNHSSDRMTSEHGVRALKLWGIARGREDSFLFQNEANFDLALKAVWALHNYKASGCPVF